MRLTLFGNMLCWYSSDFDSFKFKVFEYILPSVDTYINAERDRNM